MSEEPQKKNGFLTKYKTEITYAGTLGAIVGAISLFNLTNRYLEFGLTQIFTDILTYYQYVTGFLFGWVDRIFPFALPQTVKDLWVISFLGVALEYRSHQYWVPGFRAKVLLNSIDWYSAALYHLSRLLMVFAFIGIILFPAALVYSWKLSLRRLRKRYPQLEAEFDNHNIAILGDSLLDTVAENRKAFLREFLKCICVLTIFFALNAYGPSV